MKYLITKSKGTLTYECVEWDDQPLAIPQYVDELVKRQIDQIQCGFYDHSTGFLYTFDGKWHRIDVNQSAREELISIAKG